MAEPLASPLSATYYPIAMPRNTLLGSLVSERQMLIKDILKQQTELLEEGTNLRLRRKEMFSSRPYLNASAELKEKLENIFNQRILEIKEEDLKLDKKMEIHDLTTETHLSECLPFYLNNKLKVINGNGGIQSEKSFCEEFTLRDNISDKFRECLKNLFRGYAELLLPHNSIVENIPKLLEKSDCRVFLFGASIILDRKKSLEPILVDNYTIRKPCLLENSSKIFVLSQSIIEGFFLSIAISYHPAGLSSFFAVKPITSGSCKDYSCVGSNLLEMYESWKDHMVSEPEAGFSVNYTARRLDDIFRENNISLTNENKDRKFE